jgi:MerR HTH family regulatory protein
MPLWTGTAAAPWIGTLAAILLLNGNVTMIAQEPNPSGSLGLDMRQQPKRLPKDSTALVSASELAEIVGVELDTINNWVRYNIISRVRVGGRQLRARLFSTEEVYKAALTCELVKLGIPPSSASEAMDALWKEWKGTKAPKGWKLYAVVLPIKGEWTAMLCAQKVSGGPLYQGVRATRFHMQLPKQAFAVIPISDVFERVTKKLSELLGEMKNQRG